MWIVTGVLAAAGLCAVIEVPSLIGHRKDLLTFSCLLLLATVLMIAVALNAHVPNPLDGIAAVFRPIGKWMNGWFV